MSSSTDRHTLLLLALLAAPLSLSSCVLSIGPGGGAARSRWAWDDEDFHRGAGKGAQPGPAATKAADGKGADGAAKGEKPAAAEKRAEELAKKRRELPLAEIEIEIARQKAGEQHGAAELELQKARRVLAEAELDLATFLEHEQPQKLAKAELDVERQEFRVEQERQKLEQLTTDYAHFGEEFYAKRTAELVVWRAGRELELAQQALEHQRAALALARDRELPKKQRALEQALEQARGSLAQAEAKRARAELEASLAVQKAEAKRDDLQREIAKLEREAEAEEPLAKEVSSPGSAAEGAGEGR